ncbi:MAG: hypothetical protein ACLRMM_01145, partial [Ruminococcus callidus]|uniref:hypothetical protein n=1 Tax=Ruminococcus callidus TaxID=40519 RepID=UPI0039A23C9B
RLEFLLFLAHLILTHTFLQKNQNFFRDADETQKSLPPETTAGKKLQKTLRFSKRALRHHTCW